MVCDVLMLSQTPVSKVISAHWPPIQNMHDSIPNVVSNIKIQQQQQ